MVLAHWVNCAMALFLGPLVVLQGVLRGGSLAGAWGSVRMTSAGPVAGRLATLPRCAWRSETVRALGVLAVGYEAGQLLMRLSPDRQSLFAMLPMSSWPDACWQLLRETWKAQETAAWPVALAIEAGVGMAWLLGRGRRRSADGLGRSSAALVAAALAGLAMMGTMLWVKNNAYAFRYIFPMVVLMQVGVASLATAPLGAGPARARAWLPAVAAVAMLATAAVQYGRPSVAGVRRDLDQHCGTLTADLLDARCTHVAGDYWNVWRAVFHANLVLRDRGEARTIWGITFRSNPTIPLWVRKIPRESCRIGVAAADAEAEYWLSAHKLAPLQEGERRPTIRVLCPQPRASAGRPAAPGLREPVRIGRSVRATSHG